MGAQFLRGQTKRRFGGDDGDGVSESGEEHRSHAPSPGASVSPPLETTPPPADSEHGRIGYGRFGRLTPLALACLLIVSLLLIGIYGERSEENNPEPGQTGRLAGQPAPDVTLTLLDGSELELADLRGSVVALNFWASWCAPCRAEMPELQAVSDTAIEDENSVIIVGVGLKDDVDSNARAFVDELGLTYPIGRDTGGEHRTRGPIELAFGIDPLYPTTIFIRPDGIIDHARYGELTAEQVWSFIDGARG